MHVASAEEASIAVPSTEEAEAPATESGSDLESRQSRHNNNSTAGVPTSSAVTWMRNSRNGSSRALDQVYTHTHTTHTHMYMY
jgi:hypothetical protein